MEQLQVVSFRGIRRTAIEVLICLCGSVFLGLASQISFPLPGTPVPLTLQTLAVFLMGGLLGSRRAALSVMTYLIQGSLGVAVFAGGVADPFWFLDPKGGFLLSFIPAAYIIGKILEMRSNSSFFYLLFVLSVGQLVIYAVGMGWLSFFVGFQKAFLFGVLPFLTGAMIKIASGAFLLRGLIFFRSPCFFAK